MKKITIYLLSVIAILFICLTTFSVKAEAYDIEKSIKLNKWTKVKAETEDYSYYYKFVLHSDGYITIDSAYSRSNYDIYSTKELYNSQICYTTDFGKNLYYCKSFKSIYYALPKGTYYLVFENGKSCNPKIAFSKVNIFSTNNYCGAHAKSLPAKKAKTIVFEEKYLYDRWYKISLKKRKTITVTFSKIDSYCSFTVYDSQYNKVLCPIYSGNSYRTDTLQKGTYFLRVRKPYDGRSGICKINWK
jgi:hypothetical protein